MQVKVLKEFLGIPINSIGTILNITGHDHNPVRACQIKFDCKDEPVLIQYPTEPFCIELNTTT